MWEAPEQSQGTRGLVPVEGARQLEVAAEVRRSGLVQDVCLNAGWQDRLWDWALGGGGRRGESKGD